MDEYYHAIHPLPESLSSQLAQLVPQEAPHVQEIRLRAEQPVLFTVQGKTVPAIQYLPGSLGLNKITTPMLQECFLKLCDQSVYAHERELRQGYITITGGHRVGVAGCWQNGSFSAITSLNLRIARWVTCTIPDQVYEYLQDGAGGVLVAGVPGSGKTTFLRTLVQWLSAGDHIVCVVDERCELMAGENDGFAAKPLLCDVYTRCPKAEAVHMALRCMNPSFIVCDELGTEEDAMALEQGIASGVRFLASVHCASPEELSQKPQIRRLLQTSAFSYAAFLDGRQKPGQIAEWVKL